MFTDFVIGVKCANFWLHRGLSIYFDLYATDCLKNYFKYFDQLSTFFLSKMQGRLWKQDCLDKHKNKYYVYDNILENFAYIPFKLSDRIGQNPKDLNGKEDSEHKYDPKKEFDSEDKINQLCHNTEPEKLLIEENYS